jgi:hypothetical protein
MLLNNLCETYSKIIEARHKPILLTWEMITRYLMTVTGFIKYRDIIITIRSYRVIIEYTLGVH